MGYLGCDILCFDQRGKVVYLEVEDNLPFHFCADPPGNCLTNPVFADEVSRLDKGEKQNNNEGFSL